MHAAMNEAINEQRYQFVLSLYLIRTQYPQMGLFQPDFIWVIFRSMMPSKYIRNDDDIDEAVNEWCDGPVAAEVKYGHISKWNTSLVTNMSELFMDMKDFNDDISKWDVSSVTSCSDFRTDSALECVNTPALDTTCTGCFYPQAS